MGCAGVSQAQGGARRVQGCLHVPREPLLLLLLLLLLLETLALAPTTPGPIAA